MKENLDYGCFEVENTKNNNLPLKTNCGNNKSRFLKE